MPHSQTNQRMEAAPVGPAVGCCCGCAREIFCYLCRKRREALDLWDRFYTLRDEVEHLSEKWVGENEKIAKLSKTVEKSREYPSIKDSVSRVKDGFKTIDDRYEQLCISSRKRSPTNVERPRPRQKTTEMVLSLKLLAFARLYTKVNTLMPEATRVIGLVKLEDLIIKARPAIMEIPHAEKVDVDGHPHRQYLYDVLKKIGEENCNTIGVYGTVSGVGVSNIMRNVNNYFLNPSSICESQFAYVIWVEIQKQESREKMVETIQKDILSRLGEPAGETRQQNEQKITSLLSEQKCLFLLDGFLPGIKLEDIGISKGKVVMATNDIRGVLRTEQDLDATIEVKRLSPVGSSYMFKKLFFKTPERAKLSQAEKDEVHLILRETDGIIRHIKTAATFLGIRRNLVKWQSVRQRMESGSDELGTAGLRNLYRETYDGLDEDWKKCILFVALYPEEYAIPQNYLIECWKSLNFLRNYQRFREMRVQGESVCADLEERCLLERACEKYVKMPVLVRNLATTLPYPKKAGGGEESFVRFHPEDEGVRNPWSNNANWICGAKTNMERLPVSEKCDGLTALLLQKNAQLIHVETSLFTSIPNLLVLDLHCTGITLLPTSISSLTKLRCLYLNGCRFLQGLPVEMARLTDLEVLDIRYTRIQCEPVFISHLRSLKCLRISYEKDYVISETPRRSWSQSLEELAIEFAKGVEKSVVDRVKQDVRTGFKDGDYFKISLHSEFETYVEHFKRNSSTGAGSSYHLELTTHSPSTSGLRGSNDQAPPSENTSSDQHSDTGVSRKGKEIVEEGNGTSENPITSSNQLSDGGIFQKGKGIVELGMTSGLNKSLEDGIVKQGNGKP